MHSDLTNPNDWADDNETDARVIQGTLIKCVDGHWTQDKVSIQSGLRLLAMSTLTLLQRWENNLPVDTIFAEAGKPLPDIEQLNAAIPREQWDVGLNGEPRPPWQKQHVVYLLSPATAEKFTFANSTFGARLAVEGLRDRVGWMRAMRGDDVFPLVELSAKPMKTKFGIKQRPEFKVIEWRLLGERGGGQKVETAAPKAIGKPVKPATTTELLDDEIPF